LETDLAARGDLVSIAMVPDPFGDYDAGLLRHCFPDVMIPFKEHYVVDLGVEPERFVSRHHQRNAAKALRCVAVERCAAPVDYADEWIGLYADLVTRHRITGVPAFSRIALAGQLQVHGLESFRATADGAVVGMVHWMVANKVAYYHLAAFNEAGYRLKASFALFWVAFEHFHKNGVRWLSLGAGPGVRSTRETELGGLCRFKRGWSTGTRTAYFCGRILNREAYASLAGRTRGRGDYFPIYRNDEFH
jgi:hypothetical protein